MHWLLKSGMQRAISYLPRSESINHFFHRHVTRRVPMSEEQILKRVQWAQRHLSTLRRSALQGQFADVHAYEFGAGWDLTIALCYWSVGIERQTLVDIEPHARVDLVNHAISNLSRLDARLPALLGLPVRPLPKDHISSMDDLDERFGIRYLAPVDARATQLPSGSFSFITSSDTLEHIPHEDLVPILRECARLMAPRGVMSHLIDMMDHYRYGDPGITVYNFLKYSDKQWRWLNSPMEYQNRLRLPDYRTAAKNAELTIVEEEVRWPSATNLEVLTKMRVAERFRGLDVQELGAKSVRIVLEQ